MTGTLMKRETETQSGPHLRDFLTYRLSRVQAKLNVQASRYLKEKAGLTLTQWRIISMIGSAEAATSSDLVRSFSIDKSMLSRKLKSLVESGHVISVDDPRDNRQKRLKLSAKGRKLYDRMLPLMRARQRHLMGSLSPSEQAAIFTILEKLEGAAEATEFD